MRKFSENICASASLILLGIIIFGLCIQFIDTTIMGEDLYDSSGKLKVDTYKKEKETAIWDIPGHIRNFIGGVIGATFKVFTLDAVIFNSLGSLGLLIRGAYSMIILICVVDILWIG